MKLFQVPELPDILLSHPARGAWIEIFLIRTAAAPRQVAPRKGCVD